MNRHRPIPLLLALAFVLAWVVSPAETAAQTAGAPAPAASEPPPLRFTVTRFQVDGTNPLDPARTQAILAPFEGEYSGIEGLYEAANTLEQAIADAGHSFHRVVLPAQTLRDGAVVLEVVAFKLGRIVVKGNEHFSEENILRSMPGLVPGEVPRTRLLSQQRQIANLHPSKNVQLRLRESTTEQAIDAHLEVEDSDPHDLFLGANNTGSNATGDFRLVAGFQHSNLSGRDDQATVSATFSPTKIDRVEQIGISYAIPLYQWGGRFSAYAATSDVDSGTVEGVFDVAGAGNFMGVSYTHYLQRMGAYTHSVTAGIDDKRFENKVNFLGLPVGVNVRTRPLTIGYSGNYEHERGLTTLYLSYVRNIPRGELNTRTAYTRSRLGADPVWDAVRFGATADVNFPGNWLLRWRGDGQFTDEPLVSGEQFGIGGAGSVRGYEQREISSDMGLFSSLEAWSSPLYYGVRAVGFVDVGYVSSKKVLPGEFSSETLWGAGVGARWFWKSNLSLEVDVALPFNTASITNTGDLRVHFNSFYRF